MVRVEALDGDCGASTTEVGRSGGRESGGREGGRAGVTTSHPRLIAEMRTDRVSASSVWAGAAGWAPTCPHSSAAKNPGYRGFYPWAHQPSVWLLRAT